MDDSTRPHRLTVTAALLALAVAAVAHRPARGAVLQTSLDTLVPGGVNADGIRIGSMRYGGFTFANDGSLAVDPADITVRFSNGDGFQLMDNVQFIYDVDAAAGQSGSVSIGYRADAGGGLPIGRYVLRFNGTVPTAGPGTGELVVTETVATPNGADISPGDPVSNSATLTIHNDGPARAEDDNAEVLQLYPTYALRLEKRITLAAREAGTLNVRVVDVYQTVPEPAAAAVLAVPTAGYALLRPRPQRRPRGRVCRGVN
jgi:hypothetical protein